MTDSIFLGKAELDFTHPLSEELVLYALPRINQNLTRVMEHFYDEDTRMNDPRRMHTPLERTIFRADYEKDTIKITNELPDGGGPARQFHYMYYGNLGAPICARGKVQRILKGYSSNDGHKLRSEGGKRTVAGDLGEPRPKMLKFWSKRDCMFVYRKCVRPIGRNIIESFQESVKSAVEQALDAAYYDINYEAEMDSDIPFGISDGITENVPVGEYSPTMEEIIYGELGRIRAEEEVKEVEDQQTTIASQVTQKEEGMLRKFGNAASGIKNYLLSKFGRR
jgi:hypothetical protein